MTVADKGPEPGVLVPLEQALKMLPDGEKIHTFRNPAASVLLGADWDRTDVVKALTEAKDIRRTGFLATCMKHGLAIAHKDRWLFIATKKEDGQ